MCKVVLRRELLGAREQGWSVWTGKDVQELTSKQIKEIIKMGKEKICGLKISEDGELELDKEGFYTTNIMEHRLCNNFQPMKEGDSMVNLMYVVIGSHEENGVILYDCISSRFEQTKFGADEVKAYIKIGVISSGARLNKNGEIEVASLEYVKEKPAETKLNEPKASAEKVENKQAGKGKK